MSSPASVTGPGRAPAAMSASTVVVLLGLLLGLQPVTTDVYLPALPALQHELAASMSQVQLTFAGLLLAFGCSQLVWGPLSDRFGRRPVLLWGMGAYLLASLASALAPSMPLLIAARVAQGAAMGAAVMCARAIVRDLYEPLEGARMMSRGLSGLGVIAVTCAPVGGLLTELIHWRAALAALALFGALTLALVALRFHETIPARNPRALAPGTLWQAWRRIARHPTFVTYSLLATASYAALFTFLSTSPFVLIETLGLSRFGYGVLMAAGSLVYIAGTMACRRLLQRWGIRRSVWAAGWVTFTAGALMAGLAWLGWGRPWYGWWAVFVPQALFLLAHGVHQPVSQSGTVAPFPDMAGAASALNGFIMMAVAFPMGLWLGRMMDGTPRALALGFFGWSTVIALTAWFLVPRHGDPERH
ncbi:MAG TPA: multidrug effflux MFS transporter [Ottowia sp.]|nr:multidrug effflux MFS transporter [Ottowia sp.]HNJ46563.1 multidrug effflux MFS transporter [Ottowia sp.]HNK54218.1 multidrug effflux MFS transporter [Ottowia sp.]HNL41930.1 multidrug effflux MFS transporter [Ottowia sp.]HNN33121.1 multidrug effflux MFS transporter [Ottowia sp.]